MSEELDVERKLAFVHALVKHLLHVDDQQEIFVGIQPRGEAWRVQVRYSGFCMERESGKLSDALEELLGELNRVVSHHLEAGAQLLNETKT